MNHSSKTKRQPEPVEISEGRRVDTPPAGVWSVLGDFGNEHKWASQLSHCRRDTAAPRLGTVRTCRLARPLMGRSEVEEEVIAYDPGKTFSYKLRGAAGPFASAVGRWTIRPDAGGTFIEAAGTFQPRGQLIAVLFGRLARAVAVRGARRALNDLAAHLELGATMHHPA